MCFFLRKTASSPAYCDSTRSLRVLCCISIRLSYANLIGIREMSERANDQLADLIGSECNGHMQAGIASVTPDLRHIRLFPEDWPLCIFCFPPPTPIPYFVRTLIYSWICALPWRMRRNYVIPIHTYSSHDVGIFGPHARRGKSIMTVPRSTKLLQNIKIENDYLPK